MLFKSNLIAAPHLHAQPAKQWHMVGFLEIAIFLFATSIHNGQALAHWAGTMASLTHRIHCWIEF